MDNNKRKEIEKIIGNNLRKIREKKEYSQLKLAEDIKISKSAISQFERGNIRSISFIKIMVICEKLNCSFYDIFKGTRIYVDEKLKQNFEYNRNRLEYKSKIINQEIDNFVTMVYRIYQIPKVTLNYDKNYTPYMVENLPLVIGESIKEIRTKLSKTQKQLSAEMNIDITKNKKISKIENGKFKELNISDLIIICDALKISILHLFKDYPFSSRLLGISTSEKYTILDKTNRTIVDKFLEVLINIQEEEKKIKEYKKRKKIEDEINARAKESKNDEI